MLEWYISCQDFLWVGKYVRTYARISSQEPVSAGEGGRFAKTSGTHIDSHPKGPDVRCEGVLLARAGRRVRELLDGHPAQRPLDVVRRRLQVREVLSSDMRAREMPKSAS